MSANLDLVRSIYADWERGDWSRSDWADPDIEYTFDGFGVFPRTTWKGLTSMADGARASLEILTDYRIEAEEYRELDGRHVLVLDRRSGRAKHSGIEVGLDPVGSLGAHFFEIEAGKVITLVAYTDRDRALADLGRAE